MIDNNNAQLFGLELRDLRVYEVMLGTSQYLSVRSIAESASMNRGTTYEIIKKLHQKGLVASHYKQSRKYYAASDPEKLTNYAKAHSARVTDGLQQIENYAGLLKRSSDPVLNRFGQVFDGEEEVAVLLRDILETVSALPIKSYRVISSAEVSNHMYKKFVNFTKQRIKKRISVRVIGTGKQDVLPAYAERRWLEDAEMPPAYMIMYGNKVAQITLSKYGVVQASVVEDDAVARLHELVFDSLWGHLPN